MTSSGVSTSSGWLAASARISAVVLRPVGLRSKNSSPRRSCSVSSATHWPRSRISGDLVSVSAAISSSLSGSSPTASSQRNSTSCSRPNLLALPTTPSTGVYADRTKPSLRRRSHQDGSSTPNPASSSTAAVPDRNR
ncbi:Uncharacterised protein [Mycobacterium tuberculosis]|uniref:Uncharacterized protein n=1 Tax=Mycobacterium tuberculosis TaxID=1773 RepID=A0A654U6X9_MYCTX|nr:Uncharacterised protein [Mycobacterium tuberculosis]